MLEQIARTYRRSEGQVLQDGIGAVALVVLLVAALHI